MKNGDTSIVEDLNFDTRFCHGLSDKVKLFNKQASSHQQNQAHNPFSGYANGEKPKFDKHDANYGRPVAGSKTDLRGRKANAEVYREMLELCEMINEFGQPISKSHDDGRRVIYFGELFNIYTVINNKLVGLLLRARKQKLVDFEGETLFQKRDDFVPVTLVKSIGEIRNYFKNQQEKARQERMEAEALAYQSSD